MSRPRNVAAVVLLVVEAGLAVMGASVAYGLTAEYGRIGASRNEVFTDLAMVLVLALGVVGVIGYAAVAARPTRAVVGVAVAIPVVMLAGTWLAGPLALDHKLEVQYDATPQCDYGELGSGPGVTAAHREQATFESIDHVGWFGGGGGSGVGGCDRPMVLTEDTDVIAHYRATLEADGWRVVRDEPTRLRAEKDATAFEVTGRGRDWTVWTGPADQDSGLG